MDPLLDPLLDAARALAAGDPLRALKRVALRDDGAALALHGIALAQLGDLSRADELLARALRRFAPRDAAARARCVLARAEIALATRALAALARDRALDEAVTTLEAEGDRANALHGRLLGVRRLLVIGRTDLAARALAGVSLRGAPARLVAIAELIAAGIAQRQVRARTAREALARARDAAARAGIAALGAEVAAAAAALAAPAARVIAADVARPVALDEVEAILRSEAVVVDACRRRVCDGERAIALARRPVLFALARALAEAWPRDVPREALITRAFEVRRVNPSHRARLRVELGRLRRELRGTAEIRATAAGFALDPCRARRVVALVPPIDGSGAALLALLGDGEAWSTPALALALGHSQRTVQRLLAQLEASGQIRATGGARARRYLAPPLPEFTATLLLPAAPPIR